KDGTATLEAGYDVARDNTSGGWFATYDIKGTETEKTKIAEKLASRASQVGLTQGLSTTSYTSGKVGMWIR
ncbi:MAG: hypothetical protein IJM82_02340, partial [Synergistaceae bacterium]|nr:hypothetical protein [Synergistaceae bacterium]